MVYYPRISVLAYDYFGQIFHQKNPTGCFVKKIAGLGNVNWFQMRFVSVADWYASDQNIIYYICHFSGGFVADEQQRTHVMMKIVISEQRPNVESLKKWM